jgi:hypothetical protein
MAQHENFVRKLDSEVARGAMTGQQKIDLLQQKAHFDTKRNVIEHKYKNHVVGFVNGQMKIAETVQEILRHARRGRLVYFEAIGYNIL